MKLAIGNYKVESNFSDLDGGCHYFRVFMINGTKHLQIDNRQPIPINDPIIENSYVRGFRVKKEITRQNPIIVNHVRIQLSWLDDSGDRFNMIVKNDQELERFWLLFPRVKKAFQSDS